MSLPVIPVLLSGGRGSRLWPLSRMDRPKQLQPLVGSSTMLQATATRLDGIDDLEPPILVCGAGHATEARAQLEAVARSPQLIVAEPVGRNTAPAIAAAALLAPPDSLLVVLPADHIVTDLPAFRSSMHTALQAAAGGDLVTFGVVPTRAETGYGYIEVTGEVAPFDVVEFLEKPDGVTAARYVADGRHYWNSGMFVFRPEVVLSELRRHAPGIVEVVAQSLEGASPPVVTLGPEFASIRSIPIDVAVMEKTDRAVMVPLDVGWDDVGSWRSLWEVSDLDTEGNAVVGDALLRATSNSYIRSDGRPVVILGLDEVVVVDAGDVVFVASMDHAQDVRAVVDEIDRERPELG